MSSIYFAGTYRPIMCGIGDYTGFLTDTCPAGRWGVVSFDLEKCGFQLLNAHPPEMENVWYGLPWGGGLSATLFEQGLTGLGAKTSESLIWFQHENGFWPDSDNFVDTLKSLALPKIISFHTLHFQSRQTPSGLREEQYDLLQRILPHVDAITVFSHGVYYAVISAFPRFREKVYIIKHGIHNFPEISCLSRKEARRKLLDFLLYESNLSSADKESLLKVKSRMFSGSNTVVLGETGFLSPVKQSETLYALRDSLQNIMPQKRVVAIRIGSVREDSQKAYARYLRKEQNGIDKVLLEVWLPNDIIPLAQRAFDVNLYWPKECTQSGVVAHALGAGAVVAGRDMEGTGEILKDAGQPVDTDLRGLTLKIRDILLAPDYMGRIETESLYYASRFSWRSQAFRHYALAHRVLTGELYRSDEKSMELHGPFRALSSLK